MAFQEPAHEREGQVASLHALVGRFVRDVTFANDLGTFSAQNNDLAVEQWLRNQGYAPHPDVSQYLAGRDTGAIRANLSEYMTTNDVVDPAALY